MPKFAALSDASTTPCRRWCWASSGRTNRQVRLHPSPAKAAQVEGRSLLEKYNCVACHVIKPGEYKYTPTVKDADGIIAQAKRELSVDYNFPDHTAWSPAKLNNGTRL